ncbi:hypothetical protein KFE80_06865 [bacterium SCSIO 12696]|nr:hypothetical protein KFE80_06865 [bacterium SCSIO 12696]
MLLQTALLLTLAVADAPATTLPSTENQEGEASHDNSTDPTISWEVDKLRAVIEDQEAEHGAYGEVISESLLGLGKALQQEGKHEEAIGTLQHSMHISRVNHGIYSINQEPALRSMIESYEQLQDLPLVSQAYTQLTGLYSSHYGPSAPELLPLLEEMAGWHRQAYIDNQARDSIGYLTLSISITNSALAIAEQNPMQFANNMIELLRGSAFSSWQMNQHFRRYKSFDPSEGGSFNADREARALRSVTATSGRNYDSQEHILMDSYVIGRNAYQRIVDILNDSEAPHRERAKALVELGNWFNIYSRPTSAKDSYRKAWRVLEEHNDTEGMELILGTPDSLPNFSSGPHNTGALVETTMTIDRTGRARKIKVLRTLPEDDKKSAQRAVRIIKKTRFRPRYEDGEPVAYEGYTYNLRLIE